MLRSAGRARAPEPPAVPRELILHEIPPGTAETGICSLCEAASVSLAKNDEKRMGNEVDVPFC